MEGLDKQSNAFMVMPCSCIRNGPWDYSSVEDRRGFDFEKGCFAYCVFALDLSPSSFFRVFPTFPGLCYGIIHHHALSILLTCRLWFSNSIRASSIRVIVHPEYKDLNQGAVFLVSRALLPTDPFPPSDQAYNSHLQTQHS